jgi:GT2 family glycosyltransferase/Skp family chaperone for outer membrane proteins
MSIGAASPDISVVIPTFNRAGWVTNCLASLGHQTLSPERYEVLVVDDGSVDETPAVCAGHSKQMALKYIRIPHRGISAAKNAGINAAVGTVVLFFDDDDTAHEDLLLEHLNAHAARSEENTAVLGYTTWDRALTVTPLMHWLTEISGMLFAYRGLTDGQLLPHTYFWGGRSSCKRSLLLRGGGFNEQFTAGEDIELGYRLSKDGFQVIFNPSAVSYMSRALTYEDCWRRCERVGRALCLMSKVHPDSAVQGYCNSLGACFPWDEETLRWQVLRVQELERSIAGELTGPDRQKQVWELYDLYWWSLRGAVAKAFAEAQALNEGGGQAVRPRRLEEQYWSEYHRRAGELAARVADLQDELQAKVSDRDCMIRDLQAELQAKVSERDATIRDLQAELQAKVSERDATTRDLQAELQAKVSERDATIRDLQAELQTKVSERDAMIRAIQGELHGTSGEEYRALEAPGGEFPALQNQLRAAELARSESEARLRAVLSSRSWRWTAFFRAILGSIRPSR